MFDSTNILNEDQVRNYYSTLVIARERLERLYTGKMMFLFTNGNQADEIRYRILGFRIVAIEAGGTKNADANNLDDILKSNNIVELVIMVAYHARKGRESLAELNSFLPANDIKVLG